MAFHHHVKPHHHVVVWSVVALSTILAAASYSNATLTLAQGNYEQSEQNEPSERTKEFFGGKTKKGVKGSMPDSCKQEQEKYQNQSQQSPASTLEGRPTISKEEWEKLTEEQKKTLQDQNVVIVEHYADSYSPPAEQNYANLSEAEKQKLASEQQGSNQGSSGGELNFGNEQCQKDMIAQIQDEMKEFYDGLKGDKFFKPLDDMLAVIAKLEGGGFAELEKAGIDTAKMKELIPVIKKNTEELKAFFNEMLAVMEKFFSLRDNPTEAFKYMQGGFPHDKSRRAAEVADELVDKIDDLAEILDEVTKKLEASPTPTSEGGTSGQ